MATTSVFAAFGSAPMTTRYACTQSDGPSHHSIFLKVGKVKIENLFYFKKGSALYTVVPQWVHIRDDGSEYYNALFLYRYDCTSQKLSRISSNLKREVKNIYSPVYGESAPGAYLEELSFGEKKMLDLAQGLLVSEIAIARSRSHEKVMGELNQIFHHQDAA